MSDSEDPRATRLVLASASPRRQQLFTLFDLPFTTRIAPVDETPLPGEKPAGFSERMALAKALAVARSALGATVIGADTIVVSDGMILGKPGSEKEAWQMLLQLRGKPHEVVSGIAVARMVDGFSRVDTCITKVFMRDYSDGDIASYIRSGDPFDKAGAYAIQNPDFNPVDRIEGSYSNVVGLPLCELLGLLKTASFHLPELSCELLETRCLQLLR